MAVSYRKLWHLLLDKNLKKVDLERKAGISHYAVLQLSNDKDVSTIRLLSEKMSEKMSEKNSIKHRENY